MTTDEGEQEAGDGILRAGSASRTGGDWRVAVGVLPLPAAASYPTCGKVAGCHTSSAATSSLIYFNLFACHWFSFILKATYII